MDLGLEWEIPVNVQHSQLPSLVSTLIQSGIKLFLHQRNQIPLPLEQLAHKNKQQRLIAHIPQCQEPRIPPGMNEEGDLRRRIPFMISQRRKANNSLRRRRIVDKMSKREELAVECITKCLKILDEQIIDNFPHIVATGLFFGSSLHTAKEIVFFDCSKMLQGFQLDLATSTSGLGEFRKDYWKEREAVLSNVTRSFYKGIIMTDEFCEMTAKNLPSTRSHVCLLSRKELKLSSCSETGGDEDLVFLDNVEIFTNHFSFKDKSQCLYAISQEFANSVDNNSENNYEVLNTSSDCIVEEVSAPVRKNNRNRKVLTIQIDNMKTNELQIPPPTHHLNILNTDNKCLFCYQIPLNLKGIIPCKNTFM